MVKVKLEVNVVPRIRWWLEVMEALAISGSRRQAPRLVITFGLRHEVFVKIEREA